jgi:hypothetical protein
MSDTVPIYGVKPVTKITITVPCKVTTPPGNQNLSTYITRLSDLVDGLIQSRDTANAKTLIQYLQTEIKTSNPSVPFP